MKIFFLLLLWSLWYINFSSRTIISPILPIIEDEFAINHAVAGSIFFFLSIGYAISSLLSGAVSHRIGYKKGITLSFLILVGSLFFLRYATSYASFAVTSLFLGLGAGIYLPSILPLITAVFGRENWGKVLGFHETAASFSILSIPLIATVTLRFLEWRSLFLIFSVACLVVGILFHFFSPDLHSQKEKSGQFSHVLRRKDFWIIGMLWILATSNGLGLFNVIPLFLVKENGMELDVANTIFGLSRIGGFFVTILAGFLADRFGVKRILFLILLATGLSTISLSLAQTTPILIVTLILQSSINAGSFPVILVAISKLTEFSERSIFTGTSIAMGVVFGHGFTPMILGVVADAWNFKTGIFSLGVLTSLSCISLSGIKGSLK